MAAEKLSRPNFVRSANLLMPKTPISAKMEDYLEAILQLEREQGAVRVTDIADRLQVTTPSVTGALKTLKARDLVKHESYGDVVLTPRGRELARQVHDRHQAIVDFLSSVLHLAPEEAESDACGLEHTLGSAAQDRLVCLTQFLHDHPGLYQEWLEHLERHVAGETTSLPSGAQLADTEPAATTLDRVPPGMTVRIRKVGGSGAIRRRLLDMGLRTGVELRVARIAPLGDPVEIHLMDYHLSLRRMEAAAIEVEVVAMPLSMARAGQRVVITEQRGRGLMGQLRLEGLVPGAVVDVVQELGGIGGMVVRSNGRELRLGRGQAQRLTVRPVAQHA